MHANFIAVRAEGSAMRAHPIAVYANTAAVSANSIVPSASLNVVYANMMIVNANQVIPYATALIIGGVFQYPYNASHNGKNYSGSVYNFNSKESIVYAGIMEGNIFGEEIRIRLLKAN